MSDLAPAVTVEHSDEYTIYQFRKQTIFSWWLASAGLQLMSLFDMAFRKDFFNSLINLEV